MRPPLSADREHLYRPNVGVVLINADRKVWIGRRSGVAGIHSWQFPQGGIDPGEDVEAAARRELQEETGVTSVQVLARTEGWITYDFPPNFKGPKAARGFLGQRQVWFALRFTGDDAEVDLHAHHEVEFDRWRWADLHETQDLVVHFKRDAYAQVIAAFEHLVAA